MMKKNNFDFDFQFRVRKYIEYIFLQQRDNLREEKIINNLSNPIKEEFLNQIYGKKFEKIPFFLKNFSSECLKEISSIVKKVDIAPEEFVLKV